MSFYVGMILEEITDIEAPSEEVYRFFEEMEDNYERWHPDHITFRWTEGEGLQQGAEAYFEERIAGKVQKKTVSFVEVTPDRYMEFKPTSLLVGLLMPQISFTIDPRSDGCEFTQRIKVRTGPIGARLNKREFDAVRTHMHEEGENLKRILESENRVPSGKNH
jgi:Polyketide cyclase / dehydrase and lipid transport